MTAVEIIEKIILKGGVIGRLAKYALEDNLVEEFILECKENVEAEEIQRFWGEELISAIRSYVKAPPGTK